MSAMFIAGTDTGVGKTLVSAALLVALRNLGYRAVGMKPIAAGAEWSDGRWVNEDVELLRGASAVDVPPGLSCPFVFKEAIAPHIAAERKGTKIEIPVIVEACRALSAMSDMVVVEGAGGLLVPIDSRADMADVVSALNMPVILVVGMRLGCINHALLTLNAMRGRGLKLAGWIANRLDPDMAVYEENILALRQRIDAPMLAEIPYMSRVSVAQVAGYINNVKLLAVLDTAQSCEG